MSEFGADATDGARCAFLPRFSRRHAGTAVMEVAGNEKLAVADIAWHHHPAARSCVRAAWMEGAAGRRLERVRKGKTEPGIGDAQTRLGRKHGGEQRGWVERSETQRTHDSGRS
jgi:hypothetical protein